MRPQNADTPNFRRLIRYRPNVAHVRKMHPFHQRGAQMTVGPLNPADVAAMAGLSAADAFDAALITGGLPIICARWENGEGTRSFLSRELANPVSPLVVSAQLSLSAEFSDQVQARAVLQRSAAASAASPTSPAPPGALPIQRLPAP